MEMMMQKAYTNEEYAKMNQQLFQRLRQGEDLRNEIFELNQRLIMKAAMKSCWRETEATMDDVKSIAFLATMEMLDVYLALGEGVVQAPMAWLKKMVLYRVNEELSEKYKDIYVPYSTQKYRRQNGMGKTPETLRMEKKVSSTDREADTFADCMYQYGAEAVRSAEDSVLAMQEQDMLMDAIRSLVPRQRFIIERNFGLGCERITLQKIADLLDISESQVSRDKERALTILRKKMEVKNGRSPHSDMSFSFAV